VNRGLIAKTVREVWLSTLLFALGIMGIETALAYIIPIFFDELSGQWLELNIVQGILKGLLGTEIGSSVGLGAIGAIAWVHPIVLALIWAQEITFCTRVPAGEVDRGTVDVLLGLPVSRLRVYSCESAVWLASGLAIIAMGLVGNLLGGWLAGSEIRPTSRQLIIVILNLYCLYLAVGGVTWLVSSLSSHRAPAIGIVFGIVLASFLLSFLAQFSDLAEAISFLSMLDYYRPLLILRDASWPVTDMLVLATVGAVAWLLGATVFARRDISV
jgi:ABC-2 type transport system permease protein